MSKSAFVSPDAWAIIDAIAIGRRHILRSSVILAIRLGAAAVLCAALLVSAQPALAEFVQQGLKLVGTGATGNAEQGYAVSLSADGNTAIAGGWRDNSDLGAAWIMIRSGGVWSQQGAKLVGSGAVGHSNQGKVVALSGDSNTAIVGGAADNSLIGAAWVFTRSGGVWSQQGTKLLGTGAGGEGHSQQGGSVALSTDGNTAIVGGPGDYDSGTGNFLGAAWVFTRSSGVWTQQAKLVGSGGIGPDVYQGQSVALSGDGNTAIVGGWGDHGFIGAVWVFTRSGSVWTQQGAKLVGTGATGNAQQGISVALSVDGNTAVVGGSADNSGVGAAWVFTRSGAVWTQQGAKLVGSGFVGTGIQQGCSVALSGDGNIAMVSGPGDSSGAGAAWVFTRSGGVWTQQGAKLVGSGAAGNADQGQSVALSGDSHTAILGGPFDNFDAGAAWVFVSANATATHDFNADGKSDILSRDTNTGDVKLWLMNGGVAFPGGTIANMATNWQIVAQRDFNGDGKADILWRDNTTGTVRLFLMNGLTVTQNLTVASNVPSHYVIAGVGDFNGDGNADILWRDSNTGYVSMWFMNGATATAANVGSVPLTYSIIGTSPNGHILWRTNSTGALTEWVMNGAAVSQTHNLGTVPAPWAVVGSGDLDGNGSLDLLLRNGSTGEVKIWFYTNGVFTSSASLGNISTAFSIDLTGDFNGNGKSDIVWTHTSGARSIWFMNGGAVASTANLGTVATTFQIQSKNAE
jgi:hypothetical protein